MATKIDRAALVHAAKNMSDVLGLKPRISTKDKSDDEVLDLVKKYAKGWDEKKEEYVEDNRVTRDDELDDETFATLEAIGALPKRKAKEVIDVKAAVKSSKTEKTTSSQRGRGVRATDWKSLKAQLESVEVDDGKKTIASRMDRLLLDGGTVAELQDAAKENKLGSIMSHAAFRTTQGWVIKDGRKNPDDEKGVVKLIGYDPDAKGQKSTLLAAPRAATEKKEKKEKVDVKAKVGAAKVEKNVKKVKKDDPKATKKNSKKAKDADEDEESEESEE